MCQGKTSVEASATGGGCGCLAGPAGVAAVAASCMASSSGVTAATVTCTAAAMTATATTTVTALTHEERR